MTQEQNEKIKARYRFFHEKYRSDKSHELNQIPVTELFKMDIFEVLGEEHGNELIRIDFERIKSSYKDAYNRNVNDLKSLLFWAIENIWRDVVINNNLSTEI